MRICYIMQVDWNWIKQRPHFLAEEMAKRNEIIVFYPYSFNRRGLSENISSISYIKRYFHLPFRGRLKALAYIDLLLNKLYFYYVLRKAKPDCIWVCSPVLIKYLLVDSKNLVYDCMDDYYSMSSNPSILKDEKTVVNLSKMIFVSSVSLKEKLISRYNADKEKIYLIRNGFDGVPISTEGCPKASDDNFHLCYIGTISEWFDFEKIEYLLNNTENTIIDLFGPLGKIDQNKLKHERIKYHGTVKHSELYNTIKCFDCLIMPFVVNEIIESVDPVKLYEYINFQKNIISVEYEEIRRFDEFVFFYNTEEDLVSIVMGLMKSNVLKYSKEMKDEFLENNTWKRRANDIESLLRF